MRARTGHHGFTLADVVFATVILTTVVFGSLRLYADVTRQKEFRLRSQEAESALLSLHERERPRLFSYTLGSVDLLMLEVSGRTYEVTMEVEAVPGHPDDQLRSVEYTARYKIRGEEKLRKIVRRVHRID